VVLGNPGCRRVGLFQEALVRAGLAPALLVSWLDLLTGRDDLSVTVQPGDVVRIESPGREFEVERELLAWGAESADEEEFDRLSAQRLQALTFERGRILAPRQWYLGFRRALARVSTQLEACGDVTTMNDPAEIAMMFDKPACHAHLREAGIPVPEALGSVQSYEELLDWMERCRCPRVFVKLAHGSSASGVVAYQFQGDRHQAATTTELVREAGEVRLYNSRHIRTLRDPHEIGTLVDALGRHRVHVERWLPKAGLDGQSFDLRLLTIAGEPAHTVARLSRSPMTNLHLLNDRASVERVREQAPAVAWEAALDTCRRTAAAFPRSLHAGIDLAFSPDFRRHAVLEVNAFGDLLPGTLHAGQDTYGAELAALSRAA
jgi:glutathione synthase/RimK-type ligase-like ATP-grasp enzyme